MAPYKTFWDLLKAPPCLPAPHSGFWRLLRSDFAPTKSMVLSAIPRKEALILLSPSSDASGSRILGVAARRDLAATGQFLQSIVPLLAGNPRQAQRHIDFTGDYEPVSLLTDLELKPAHETVWVVDGIDATSLMVDLGQVVCAPRITRALANMVCPDQPGAGNTRYRAIARELLVGAVSDLNAAGVLWLIGDLLDAIAAPAPGARINSQTLARSTPAFRRFANERQTSDALAVLATTLSPFTAIADLSGIACLGIWLIAGLLAPFIVTRNVCGGSASTLRQLHEGGRD